MQRILEQRLNLFSNPMVPYRFFLTNSNKHHFGISSTNYRKIIKQDFSIKW